MPFEYKALDPNKKRPLTTGEHLQLLANPDANPAPTVSLSGEQGTQIGLAAQRFSRPGGTPPAGFGVPVTGGAQVGSQHPLARVGIPGASVQGAAGQEIAAPGGSQGPVRPNAPDFSQFMIDPATNPHGASRPEGDPRADRRQRAAQLLSAGAGALGLVFGSDALAHAGAGFAQGVDSVRAADQQRIAEQQEAWGNWLQQAERNNREMQLRDVQTRFGLDEREWRDQVATQEREAQRQHQLERDEAARQDRIQSQGQAAIERQANQLMDAGQFDQARPLLIQQGWSEEGADALLSGREMIFNVDQQRRRRLAYGGGGSQSVRLSRLYTLNNINAERAELQATMDNARSELATARQSLRTAQATQIHGQINTAQAEVSRLQSVFDDAESRFNRLGEHRNSRIDSLNDDELDLYLDSENRMRLIGPSTRGGLYLEQARGMLGQNDTPETRYAVYDMLEALVQGRRLTQAEADAILNEVWD